MLGILGKLGLVSLVVAAFSGCIDEEYYESSSWSKGRRISSQESETECDIPDARRAAPKDPLHVDESRDVHGYASKSWRWHVGACEVIAYNVTFKMNGAGEHLDAVAVTFRVGLVDPEGRTIVEQRDTAMLSESETVLDWSLKPGAPVEPGEWTLSFTASGDYHYDAKVYLEY